MALIIEKVLETRFELTYNSEPTLSSDKNGLTTTGIYCHFKTGTGANLIKQQNVPFSDITIIDTYGSTGTFTGFANQNALHSKLRELGFFNGSATVTGTGSTTFLALTDTPVYAGNNGKTLIINEAENRLDAINFYNYNLLTQMDDVEVPSLVEGKILGVGLVGGVKKFTLIDKPLDGTTYFSAVGGFDYDDLETAATPILFTGTPIKLINDTLGVSTFLSQPPYGVTSVWDEATNSLDFSQLSEGDEVILRVNIDHTTTSVSQESKLYLKFTDDVAGVFDVSIDNSIENKTIGAHNITRSIHFYVRNGWKNNPVDIYYDSDDDSSIIVNGWHPYIIRKSINILDVQVKGGSEKPPYELATEGQTEILIDASADNVDVWINQVMQTETIDYNRLAGVVTMTYALSENDSIVHRTYTSESVKEIFTADDLDTNVTLTSSPRSVDIWVNGVYQIEDIAYTISGNIITFTYSLSDGDYITVRKHR